MNINEMGLLLQTTLEGVVEEDEFRASNSQFNFYINYLKFSMSSWKETLISCSEMSEIAEYKIQRIILCVDDLNLQFCKISSVKIRH